jgi:GT2 family glycosyltransferase
VLCNDEKAMIAPPLSPADLPVNLTIDIIIPTYDRPALIPGLVEAISAQLRPHDHIYIIWQGNKKPELAESERVTYVHSEPPNLPKARNLGIKTGAGDICLFLDDDVKIISKDMVERHRAVHEQHGIGAVAGYLEDPVFIKSNEAPSKYDETTGELVQNFSLDKSQYAISVMGAHMSFKRKALVDCGGFDEQFKANALWEEIDCAFRISTTGWKIFYCAEAKVRHLREQSGGCRNQKERGVNYIYHQFANTAYFASRHAQPKYYRSWLKYWKYRLEFLSRKKGTFFKHDPWLVGAGILGACGGVLRYLICGGGNLKVFQNHR